MPIQGNLPTWPRHDIIKAEAFCTICGKRFDFLRLQVLDEQDGATLMYIRCGHCMTGSISSISVGQGKLKFVTAPTDLTEEEIMHFRDEDQLIADNVLEIHAHLESHENFLETI